MEKYKIAYEYLITFEDYFCAKQGIKEYVNHCICQVLSAMDLIKNIKYIYNDLHNNNDKIFLCILYDIICDMFF